MTIGSARGPEAPRPGPRRLEPGTAAVRARGEAGQAALASRSFSAAQGRCPGCSLSSRTGYVSCSVQDLLHGFDSKSDKLYLTLFEIF